MKILFLNSSFPGPFSAIAEWVADFRDNEVLFASEYGNRNFAIPQVKRVIIKSPKNKSRINLYSSVYNFDDAEYHMNMMFQRARFTALTLLQLRKSGFVPDIIILSATMGNGLFIRDIFPESFFITYANWYSNINNENSSNISDDYYNSSQKIRNIFQENIIMNSNMAFTFTNWQKKQYPPCLRKHMQVLPYAIDTKYFSPAEVDKIQLPGACISGKTDILTISLRNALSQDVLSLLRCLPEVLERRPECHVVILPSRLDRQTDKLFSFAYEIGETVLSRIHLLSFLPPDIYLQLLQSTSLFLYVKTAYSPGVELLEAMSCACPLLAIGDEVVRGTIKHGENGFICDSNSERLKKILLDLLEDHNKTKVGMAARQYVFEHNNKNDIILLYERIFLSAFYKWKK